MSTAKVINVQHPSASTTNIVNDASGNVAVGNNLTVAGTATVAGVAAIAVAPSTSGNVLTSNGTVWTSAAPSGGGAPSAIGQIPFSTNGSTYTATQKIVLGTAVASTSGTSIDFTGIPSWVKRVTVMFKGVSFSGSAGYVARLGTSGGIESSGYVGCSGTQPNSTAFELSGGSASGATTYNGAIILSLQETSSYTWAEFGNLARGDGAICLPSGGYKSLAGTLTQVRLTSTNGTDTFDAGSINILYE